MVSEANGAGKKDPSNSETNFLRGTQPGKLRGVSTPVHLGRTTMVWTTEITNEAGKKLAVVTQTQIVLPGVAKHQQALKNEG